MKRTLVLLLLVLIATLQDSPAQKRKAERAYAAFEAGEYYDAIDEFKDTYSRTKRSGQSCQNGNGLHDRRVLSSYKRSKECRNMV